MPKKIIIREDQVKDLITGVALDNNPVPCYPIEPAKVLIVKKFLDKTFKKGVENIVGNDGRVGTIAVISMVYPDGTIAQERMDHQTILDMLADEFPNMYDDEDRRNKFLGQVMQDWYNNKIGLYGSLSVNHL